MVNHYVLKRFCLLIFLWLFGVCVGFSAEITSIANGNWSDPATWNNGIPAGDDQVVIKHLVAVDQVTQIIGSLKIEVEGQLVAGTGISELRLSGPLDNSGILNLYNGPGAYTAILLSDVSHWKGAGAWNLAGLQLVSGAYWTFADGMQIRINKDLQADGTSTINDFFGSPGTELIFSGPESGTITSAPTAFYPVLVVDKEAGAIVSFADSEGFNTLQIWFFFIQKTSDVLDLGANNILEIYQDDFGPGSLQGSATTGSPSRMTSGYAGALTALRVKAGTIKVDTDLEISGDLNLNDSDANLDISGHEFTVGGTISGDGSFTSDESTSLSLLNVGPAVQLRFTAGSSVGTLEIGSADQGVASQVTLESNLRIAGELKNTPPLNEFIAAGELELAGSYTGAGKLGGTENATLLLSGDGARLVLPMSGNGGFKQVQVSRTTGVTFSNNFRITDELNSLAPVSLRDGILTLGSAGSAPGRLVLDPGTSLDLGNGGIRFEGSADISIPAGSYLSGSDEAQIEFAGATANATLRFSPDSLKSRLRSIVLSKPNSEVTLGSPVSVIERVSVDGNSATLHSNGFLSLASTASGSANVEPLLNGASITGSVRVERYISGGPKDQFRGYRMLSSPVYDNTTDFPAEDRTTAFLQYIDDIYVTGPNPAGGFDIFPGNPNNPTIWTYNESALASSGQDYTGINSINDVLPAGRGAMIFYRGARINPGGKLKAPYDHPEGVTLDFEGILNQGPVTVPLAHTANGDATDGFNLLGNPYASALDWNSAAWTKTNITGQIWIYNPAGKQYAIFDGENGTNGGNQYIAPGQAFFVKVTGAGSITFNEGVKANKTANRDFPLFMNAPVMAGSFSAEQPVVLKGPDRDRIRIRLVKDEWSSDESLIVFRGGSKPEYTLEDARDMHGEQVFLSTLSADSVQLGINYMPPVPSVNRIGMYASASAYGTYVLEFPEFAVSGKIAVHLNDRFLDRKIEVHAGTSYAFEVTADKASYGSGRFELLFEKVKPPVEVEEFTGKKTGTSVKLQWTTRMNADAGNDRPVFELERSADGATFTKLAQVVADATGQPVLNYSYQDRDPRQGSNSYRLRTKFADGSETVSGVITVIFDLIRGKDDRSVLYPNPAESDITIRLENIPKVRGQLNIYDKSGKKVITRNVGSLSKGTEINQQVSQLKQGVYFVELLDADNNKQVFSSKLIKR